MPAIVSSMRCLSASVPKLFSLVDVYRSQQAWISSELNEVYSISHLAHSGLSIRIPFCSQQSYYTQPHTDIKKPKAAFWLQKVFNEA